MYGLVTYPSTQQEMVLQLKSVLHRFNFIVYMDVLKKMTENLRHVVSVPAEILFNLFIPYHLPY
jgi:hypothetical protein